MFHANECCGSPRLLGRACAGAKTPQLSVSPISRRSLSARKSSMEARQFSAAIDISQGNNLISGQLQQRSPEVELSISGAKQPAMERRRMGDAPRPFEPASTTETVNNDNDFNQMITSVDAPVSTVVRTSLPPIANSVDQTPTARVQASGSGASQDGRSRRGLRAAQSLDAGISSLRSGAKRGRQVTRVARVAGGRPNAVETSLVRKVISVL
jgi:hypothetical protein